MEIVFLLSGPTKGQRLGQLWANSGNYFSEMCIKFMALDVSMV